MTSLRVVAAGAGEHRHLAVGFVDAGSRRCAARSASVSVGLSPVVPHGHEEVDAGVDLPAAEPPNRRFVELAGLA